MFDKKEVSLIGLLLLKDFVAVVAQGFVDFGGASGAVCSVLEVRIRTLESTANIVAL